MRILMIPLSLCANGALAHALDGDATSVEATRHLLLGGHHAALAILASAAAGSLVYALLRLRQRTPREHSLRAPRRLRSGDENS